MAQARKARQEIELTGEAKYKAALKSIESNLRGVAVQQKLLDSEYAKGDTSMAKMSRQYDLMGSKLQAQKNRLQLIKAELDRVTVAQGSDSEAAQKLRNAYAMAQRDVNNTERAMSALSAQIAAASKHATTFMERMREMHITLPAVADKMDKLGSRMTKALSAPIAALGVAAGKAFLDYDKGLATLSTLADTTQIDMKTLSAALLEASSVSGMAAEGIADAAYSALSAGVETKNVASFTTAAAKAAKAGLTDVETVVDGATSAINAWSLGYENAEQVLDKFIVAQNLGKTTVGDLAQNIGQLTGIAPQVGVSLDSMLAATAALTKNGVQTSSAMNGLKAVMNAVIKPTAEASKMARKLKLDFSAENIRVKGFTGFLQEVIEKTGGSEEKLATLFGSVEGLSQVMLLAGGAADDYAAALTALEGSAGAVDRAFEKVASSKAEQLALAMNNVKNQGIRLGETFAPAMQMVADGISTAADMMGALNDEQLAAIANWGLMIAALGPLTSGIGKTLKSVNGLVKGFKLLNTLTGGIAGPAALALTAVVALVAGVKALDQYFDSLEGVKQIKAAFDNITIDQSAVQAAVDAASETEYQLRIHVQEKLEFESAGGALTEQISEYWGRKQPTKQEQRAFKQGVADWVAPLIAAGKGAVEEETQGLAVDLELASAEYSKYALQLAKSSKNPTEEQLAELQLLHDKVIAIGEEIMVATDAAASAAQAAYVRTKRGAGTTKDAALAVEWAQMQYDEDLIRANLTYDPLIEAAETAMVAADKSGDTQAYETAMAAYDEALAGAAEAERTASEKYTESVNELITGLAQRYPDQMETLRYVAEQQKKIEEALTIAEGDMPEGRTSQEQQQLIRQEYEKLTGKTADSFTTLPMLLEAINEARGNVATAVEGADLSGLMEDFYAQVQSGLLDEVDAEMLSGDLSAILTAVDLADDGSTIGAQIITGEIDGIKNEQAAINQAMLDHCKEVISTAMTGYDINSPSKKFDEIGYNTMAGEAGGITRGGVLALAAMQRHIASMAAVAQGMNAVGAAAGDAMIAGLLSRASAYRQALASMAGGENTGSGGSAPSGNAPGAGDGSSPGGNVTNQVSINYSGSVSQRDVQRMAQMLGAYISG